ncbi:MAG: FHA domain-containing protein [Planctomycetota bacterium]|nr:FHA domain-containing protein [Planctomycetota bacterium]
MTLTLLRVDDPNESLETTELPVVIGRSDDVQVRVECRWASRKRCEIDQVDGEFVLRDLGSRYGTIVNGKSVRQIVLSPGDEIGVGLKRFVVMWADDLMGMEHESVTEFESKAI